MTEKTLEKISNSMLWNLAFSEDCMINPATAKNLKSNVEFLENKHQTHSFRKLMNPVSGKPGVVTLIFFCSDMY